MSDLTCIWHFVRARLHLGQWDSFLWHTEESWHFSPPKEALAQLIYCLSGNYLIQQSFIEHLLYVRCSLEYVAFYGTWHLFSPVTHRTILHLRVWWRSWHLYDGWRNWCLEKLCELTKVQKVQLRSSGSAHMCFLFHYVRLPLPWATFPFCGDKHICVQPFPAGCWYWGSICWMSPKTSPRKRKTWLLLGPEGLPLETGTVQGLVIAACRGHQHTSLSFSLTPAVQWCCKEEAHCDSLYSSPGHGGRSIGEL